MNMEEIRGIPITDFLARLGHEPKRQRGDECRYLAPYREERTASFQVNIRKNVWHDFGTGRGGDIFTLAGELTDSRDFKEQVDFITRIYGGLAPERKTVFRPKENGKDNPDKKECLTDIRFGPLYNKVLLRYLEERGICSGVALPNCEEARYTLHGKRYFAIGFRNLSGGYELRNRFFKGSLSPKDISLMENGSDTCNLFEGFIDYLSWMVLGLGCGDDYLVLNSVALLERSYGFLDRYGHIRCYLDRDEAGRRTLEALRKRYGNKIEDCSALYKGYKDLNEYLQNMGKYSINSLVYWVTYVHNVVYSFYRSMIYCYINSTQRCAGSIVIDIIPTNGADKRKFFPFAPYFPVTNVIKRYFYPYFPAIIGIKGYSFPYFPYLSGIMKIKTALYSLFSRLDWHKTVVFPCLGEIYEGIRSLSWEIPVT